MADVIIPTPVGELNPSTVLTTTLDGQSYRIVLHWNGRANRWQGCLQDGTGNVLAGFERFVANMRPWYRFRKTVGMPPGVFLIADESLTGTDPGLNDLGNRCKLLYRTAT